MQRQTVILVVESDEAVVGGMRAGLESYGYRVFSSPTVEAGLMAIDECFPEVILACGQIGLPFYEALGGRPDGKRLQRKVAFVTGGIEGTLLEKGRPLLLRPFREQDVEFVIAQILAE